MTNTPENLRRELADVAADASNSQRSAGEILKSAADRRKVVTSRMDELKIKALTESSAADEYIALVEERGTLDRVLRGAHD